MAISAPQFRITSPTEVARPSLGALLRSSALSSYGGLRYGVPQAVQAMRGDLTEDENQRFGALNTAVQRQAEALAPGGAAQFSDLSLVGGNVGIGRFIAENLAYMAPQMAGSLIGGAITRSPAGAIAGGTPQFFGANITRAAGDDGTIDEGAAYRSLAAAPVQSALDTAVLGFIPGLRALSPVSGAFTGGFLKRTAKSIGSAALTEGVTEATQQVGERFAAGLPLANGDAAREYVQSFATAAAIGGVLGSAGGFQRRTGLENTPPDQVTNDQLTQHVDMLMLPAPTMYTDAAGRSEMGDSGLNKLIATPRTSETPLDLATTPGAFDVSTPLGLPAPADFVVGPEGVASTPAQDAMDEAAAALSIRVSQMPSGDLKAVLERAQQRSDVEPAVVEAVERELAARGAQQGGTATGAAPASTPTIWDGWAEIGRGNQDLVGMKPQSEVEARERVYDMIFDRQDERKSTVKAAIKLGLLDENLNPTAVANQMMEQRKAAAPVVNRSLEVEAILRPALANRQAPADVKALAAAKDDAEFDRMVVEALQGAGEVPDTAPEGGQQVEPKWTRKGDVQTPSTALEAIALQRGLLVETEAADGTKLVDYSDQARQLMTAMAPPSFEEAAEAALKQNLTGAQASAFVQGATGKEFSPPRPASVNALEDIGELTGNDPAFFDAYKAGQQWRVAATKVTPMATTMETMKRPVAFTDPARAISSKSANYSLTAEQQVAQDLGVALSETGLDKSHPAEYAALRDRIAKGVTVTPQQLAEDVRAVRAGLSVAPQLSKPFEFKPARVDSTSRALRGINPLVKAAIAEKQLVKTQGTKAQQRAESTAAAADFKFKNDLRADLRAQADTGTISRADFIRYTAALNRGDLQTVAKALGWETFEEFDFSEPNDAEAVLVENTLAFIKPTDMQGVLDALRDIAPNRFYDILITRMQAMVRMLERAGVEFSFEVVNAPYRLVGSGTSGVANFRGNQVRLAFNSVDSPGRTGTTFNTILHEMIHAVTVKLLDGANRVSMPDGQAKEATKALYAVGNHIVNLLVARRDAGTLSAVEQGILERTNALSNVQEIIAWALTNPEFQAWLDTVEYEPKLSFFQKLVQVFRTLLGMPAKYDSALAEIIRATDALTSVEDLEIRQALNRSKYMAGAVDEFGYTVAPPTVSQLNQRTQEVIRPLLDAARRTSITKSGVTNAMRPIALGWLSLDHIAEQMGDVLPGLRTILEAHAKRRATSARLAQLYMGVHQRFEQAKQAYPKLDSTLNELMSVAAEFGLDPRKTWDQHTWLKGVKDEAELKQKLRSMNQKYLDLKSKGYANFFDEFLAVNESDKLAYTALTFYQNVVRDAEYSKGVKGFDTNPIDAFLSNPNIHEDPVKARDYWKQVLEGQIELSGEYIRATQGEMIALNQQDQDRVRLHLNPLERQIRSAKRALDFDNQRPYFHLGRFGDYVVRFDIATPKEGAAPDPKVVAQVAKALEEAGFDDVMVSPDNPGAGVFIRLEAKAAQMQLEQLARDLEAKGLVAKKSIKSHKGDSGMFNDPASGNLKNHIDKVIQSVLASPMFSTDGLDNDAAQAVLAWKARTESGIRQAHLDLLPDTALEKFFVRRRARSGYNKNMIRNQAFRHQAASVALAGASVVSEIGKAFEGMKGTLNDAKRADSPLHDRVDQIHDVIREVQLREAKQSEVEISEPIDNVRAVTNAWFLGMSPAYWLTNITQIPVLLWPELAKKGGFVAAAKALAKVTPDAFAILKETWAEAQKGATSLVDPNRAEMLISHEVLERALVSGKTGAEAAEARRKVDFMVKMIGSASIDIGGATREQGRVVGGTAGSDTKGFSGKIDAALKWASVGGLYSETFGRLVAALAAREVSRGEADVDVEAYAKKTVNEAMYNYSDADIARYMSRAGWAGPMTKVMTQFMTYMAKTLEKLYRETHAAVGGDKAAARFLVGHATALTALAGTMGLPFVSVFAGALEALVDLVDDDDEPYDATAAYRNWLASVFGEDIAEIIARGAPRALGFDLSQRIGEQDLLPLAGMLFDSRATEDILAEQALRSYGPAVSMATGWFTGGRKMLDGDYMGGLVDMSPTFLKSFAKTYRMGDQGYVDNKGNALPMSPTAAAYLYQLLGFTPAARAEYTEALGDQFGRKTSLTREATVIRNRVVKALMSGDTETAKEWLARAQQFDQDSPQYAVLPDIERAVARRAREAAMARSIGSPLGVNPKDVGARDLTAYANLN